MAYVTILDFKNCIILLPDGVRRDETHHAAEFCEKHSINCGDIAILLFFQMAAIRNTCEAVRHDAFSCAFQVKICLGHIWTTHTEYLVVTIIVQNLITTNAVVSIIWKY